MTTTKRRCRLCRSPFSGRSDKIFCTIACKNEYHVRLRRATAYTVRETDKILHRNRSILLEIMGKNKKQKKVDRLILEKKKFRFQSVFGIFSLWRKQSIFCLDEAHFEVHTWKVRTEK